MATNDTAAVCFVRKSFTRASFAVFMSIALTGCGTGTSLFNSSGPNALSLPSATTANGPNAQGQTAASKVAIAPVIGAPDNISKQIQSQLTAALAQRNIGIGSSTSSGADYTLRGYVVSSKEANGTKISYIWDVTDPTGKRVNRITGEELAPISAGRDPWQSVTPQITQTIASKTAGSLAAWLPTQARSNPAIAQNTTPPASGATATVPTAPVQPAALTPGSAAGVTAVIPTVVGAPGDGSISLTNAIQRELQRNGVGLANSAGGQNYTVQGRVKVAASTAGKEKIQIDWDVKDPQGKKLGTVSQKNDIPQGSLNGAWGATANAAAAAAAQGILKLLPKTRAQATTSSGTL